MRDSNRRLKSSQKEPRALRPNQFIAKWHEVHREHTQLRQTLTEKTQQLSVNTIDFFEQILGFKPYNYQKDFAELFENNQFTAARWCRQSGKTQTISALLLKYAITHPNAAIGVVGPSWRQTKRIIARIAAFTHKLPSGIVFKPQKIKIDFANGSSIEAFPNNPDTIRGPTLNVVYCLPAGVRVNLANGTQVPIQQLEPGQSVLSYNLKTGGIEPKRVLRVFRNPRADRTIMRLSHAYGKLDCTAEHKIYTLKRGYIHASELTPKDKILYLTRATTIKVGGINEISPLNPPLNPPDGDPKATNLWWAVRRPLYPKTSKLKKKRPISCKSFYQASEVSGIQVFYSEESLRTPPKEVPNLGG